MNDRGGRFAENCVFIKQEYDEDIAIEETNNAVVFNQEYNEDEVGGHSKLLRTSNKQIKAECSIQGPSEDPLILNTNTNITIKCESLELQDLKDDVPTNYTSADKISGEMSLKSEFEEAPIDNSSLMSTEYTDNLIDPVSEGDKGVENLEIEKQWEKLTGLRFADVTENFAKREDGNKNTSSNHKKDDKSIKIKYKCGMCNTCFGYLSDLNNHIQTQHTVDKPYQCDVCSKCFDRLDALRYHQRVQKCGKMYQCTVCNKNFNRMSNLKKHQSIHTGEKPHLCDVCGKCFTDPGNLSKHRKIHIGEKMYRCDVCNTSFTGSFKLKIHQQDMHWNC